MAWELLYTSSERGLRPGSQGFCTVAASRDLPAAWWERIEALAGYRHAHPPGDGRNPVGWGHVRVRLGGRPRSVLWRIADAGADYSGRSNKFAHFLIPGDDELVPLGPAGLVGFPGLFAERWDGRVGFRDGAVRLPRHDGAGDSWTHWEQWTGDGYWRDACLQAARDGRRVVIVGRDGRGAVPLLREAGRAITPARRWDMTFVTPGVRVPDTVEWAWRLTTAEEWAEEATKSSRLLVLDLNRPLGRAPAAVPPRERAVPVWGPSVPVESPSAAIEVAEWNSDFADAADEYKPPPRRRKRVFVRVMAAVTVAAILGAVVVIGTWPGRRDVPAPTPASPQAQAIRPEKVRAVGPPPIVLCSPTNGPAVVVLDAVRYVRAERAKSTISQLMTATSPLDRACSYYLLSNTPRSNPEIVPATAALAVAPKSKADAVPQAKPTPRPEPRKPPSRKSSESRPDAPLKPTFVQLRLNKPFTVDLAKAEGAELKMIDIDNDLRCERSGENYSIFLKNHKPDKLLMRINLGESKVEFRLIDNHQYLSDSVFTVRVDKKLLGVFYFRDPKADRGPNRKPPTMLKEDAADWSLLFGQNTADKDKFKQGAVSRNAINVISLTALGAKISGTFRLNGPDATFDSSDKLYNIKLRYLQPEWLLNVKPRPPDDFKWTRIKIVRRIKIEGHEVEIPVYDYSAGTKP